MAAVRRSIQRSPERLQVLAKWHSIHSKAVAKWRKRPTAADAPMGPKPASTVLSAEQEAIAVAFRQHTLPPLDNCWYALPETIPHRSCSALHRCFERHSVSWLPLPDDSQSLPAKKFQDHPIGYPHVDFAEVRTEEGRQYRPNAYGTFSWSSTTPARLGVVKQLRKTSDSVLRHTCPGLLP